MRTIPTIVSFVIASAVGAQTTTDRGIVRGSVADAAGRGLAGADVFLFPDAFRARTDSAGRFIFAAVNAGFYHVRARRVGFLPAEVTTDLAKRGQVDVSITLVPRPIRLDTIAIVANAKCEPHSLTGFACRKQSIRRGGVFLTDDDLLDKNAVELGDVFRDLEGFRIEMVPTAWGAKPRPLATRGARCLNALVNGRPIAPANPLPRYADELIAVEIYASPTDVPEEFQRYVWMASIRQTANPTGKDSPTARCALAVYWTAFV
jgi:hypothetical protein